MPMFCSELIRNQAVMGSKLKFLSIVCLPQGGNYQAYGRNLELAPWEGG